MFPLQNLARKELTQFSPLQISYFFQNYECTACPLNNMFIFDKCWHSWAAGDTWQMWTRMKGISRCVSYKKYYKRRN